MKKCIIFHTYYNKFGVKEALILIISLFLSSMEPVFAQTNCIEPLEDIHPELKGLIQNDKQGELGPPLPKLPNPEIIIIDLTGKIH